MSTQPEVFEVYRGASAIIHYRLQLAPVPPATVGEFQRLGGYRVTLKVKRQNSDTGLLYTGYATVRETDDTWADFGIPKGSLDWTGHRFIGCVEAENSITGDFQPDAFVLVLKDHP